MMPLSISLLNPWFMVLRSISQDVSVGGSAYPFGKGENLSFILFAALAVLLLLVCAMLAGLTLAICSLDMTRLQVLSMAGDQKKRNKALVLSRIKRHTSWFLCSMIISSVACAEAIPIIIEILFGTGWLPLVVSTIAIAIFAELLPQYLIPRKAIVWGYYCWPFIWGCMWLTCVVSWPLSYLLETMCGPQTDRGIYTLDQLEILIKFHERAEKHGGILGPDASRVMRSALHLDYQTLRGEHQPSEGNGKAPLADVERGEAVRAGILVPWSSVRRIDINEEVTKELILRIKKWAYSRIPVVSDLEAGGNHGSTDCCKGWNNQKVYGFLHTKNLVGLDLPHRDLQSRKLFVKDLPLYPLPIIRDDMPLYDLLNVFQLGMARIAVVIPTPTKDRLVPLSASLRNRDALPRYGAPLWSVSKGLNARSIIEMLALDAHIDWTTDFLDAAQNEIKVPPHRKHSVIGIGCPKPIGIVTYEDILDALLQKTSLDEKDYFDRDHVIPPTKRRKEGDIKSASSNHITARSKNTIPVSAAKVHAAFERSESRADENDSIIRLRIISGPKNSKSKVSNGIIRRRNIAGPDDGVDGTSEQSGPGFDGANERSGTLRIDTTNDRSSYTENTLGGFHDRSDGAVSKFSWDEPETFPIDSCSNSIDSPNPVFAVISSTITTTDGSQQGGMARTPDTVAKPGIVADNIILNSPQSEEVLLREESFHDDRTLLPSQKKQEDRKSQPARRRTSLWF